MRSVCLRLSRVMKVLMRYINVFVVTDELLWRESSSPVEPSYELEIGLSRPNPKVLHNLRRE